MTVQHWAAPSLEQVVEMAQGILPREFESWDEVPGQHRKLLPTPDASVFNDGQTVEAWANRKERELAKRYNGNGGGTPLAMLVKLLPTTPTAADAKSTRPT